MSEVTATPEQVLELLKGWAEWDDMWGDDINVQALKFCMRVVIPVYAEYVERTRPNSRRTWP